MTQNDHLSTKVDRDKSDALLNQGTEPLWTVDDVAEYLRLNSETVRTMARRGELPSLKAGKRLWRFRPSEIKNWLNLRNRVMDVDAEG